VTKSTTALEGAARKEAMSRHLLSVRAIHDAMRTIQCEFERNEGIYPLNGGKITVQEVLRRAGKSSAYLEKKSEKIIQLKGEVARWVTEVNGRALRGAKTIRKAVTERITQVADDLRMLRQRYAEAELEYLETQQQLAAAQKTIEELRQQNARLQSKISEGKVVSVFNRRRTT